MYDKLNLVGKYFWLIISIVLSCLLFSYLYNEYPNIVLLSFSPIFCYLGYILSQKNNRTSRYIATTIPVYLIENITFFIFFIILLYFLKQNYNYIKIIFFMLLTAIGVFNTYVLIKIKSQLK